MTDAADLSEFLKFRYSAPPECCKCGDCQLVPMDKLRAAVERIEIMKRRIKVYETVILEELDPTDCRDRANQMIVEQLCEQRVP